MDPRGVNDATGTRRTGRGSAYLRAVLVVACAGSFVASVGGASAAVPDPASLIGRGAETIVTVSNSPGNVRGVATDGNKIWLRTSNNAKALIEVNYSDLTINPGGTSSVTGTIRTFTSSASLSTESTDIAYSAGCIFIEATDATLHCIDTTTWTTNAVDVPGAKSLPVGRSWLVRNLIDFPDGRVGKVSAQSGSGSSWSSTLRLYTVTRAGGATTLTWSEDMTLPDTASFPADDHGIATDGTFLYRIRFASGYKVWRLASGAASTLEFNGDGSGACGVSGTMCSINPSGIGNATFIAHDHIHNRYIVGDYNAGKFYITGAADPGPGPGQTTTTSTTTSTTTTTTSTTTTTTTVPATTTSTTAMSQSQSTSTTSAVPPTVATLPPTTSSTTSTPSTTVVSSVPPRTVSVTTVAATSTSTSTTVVDSGPEPAAVATGEASASIDGAPASVGMKREESGLVLFVGDLRCRITARDRDGRAVAPDTGGTLSFEPGGRLEFNVSGFMPGSDVEYWMFSKGINLGRSTVSMKGESSAVAPLPVSIKEGVHRLLLRGTDTDGRAFDMTLGVLVRSSDGGTSGIQRLVYVMLALALVGGLVLPGRLVMGKRRRSDD